MRFTLIFQREQAKTAHTLTAALSKVWVGTCQNRVNGNTPEHRYKEENGTPLLHPFTNAAKHQSHSQPNFLARGQLCNQIIDRITADRMTPIGAQFTQRKKHKSPLMHSWMRQH